jgi:gliding motility-associated-like protein
VVDLPPVRIDRQLVEADFLARVVRYGTVFAGWIEAVGATQVPQPLEPGNALDRLPSNDLMVQIDLHREVMSGVTVTPNPFTPNGDGIHDRCQFRYSLLKLERPVPVRVTIWDRQGRSVREVYAGRDRGGWYGRWWDGRDGTGRVVPPGIYIYRLAVEGDVGLQAMMGTLMVVY